MVWHNEFPGEGTCVGQRAVIAFAESLTESFGGTGGALDALDVDRVAEGEDSVVVRLHTVLKGTASGIPLAFHWAAALRISEGKVSRVDVHGHRDKALRAAGLEE